MSSADETWLSEAAVDETAPSERYHRGQRLGSGAMGTVDALHDHRLNRVVAKKTLRKGVAAGGFVREARLTAALEHPGVVPIYDAGEDEDGPWYTMRRIEGHSLKDALSKTEGLQDRLRLIEPFARVCEAMAYAHGRGIVHRDLKPANVMLGDFGEVMVVDFGLAWEVEGDGDLRIVGTPAYMSPEAARAEPPGPRMDVWSLGAVLYEVLAGRAPYQGGAKAVVQAVRDKNPPPLRQLVPDAPAELIDIAEKAMGRDLDIRYPDAAALRADVEAFTTGRLVGAHAYSPGELLRRFWGEYRMPLTVAAIAIVVVAAVSTMAFVQTQQQRDRAVEAEADRTRQLALALEARARAQGRSPLALQSARQALALAPELPWARGVLAEFADLVLPTPVAVEADLEGCTTVIPLDDAVIVHCGAELYALDRDTGRILHSVAWERAPRLLGDGRLAGPGKQLDLATWEAGRLTLADPVPMDSQGTSMIGVAERLTWNDDYEVLLLRQALGVRSFLGLSDGQWDLVSTTEGPLVQSLYPSQGHQLVVGHEQTELCLPDLTDCRRLHVPGVVQHALWQPSGTALVLVVTTGEAYLYELATDTMSVLERNGSGGVQELAWAGDHVAALSVTGVIQLFDLGGSVIAVMDSGSRELKSLSGSRGRVWAAGGEGVISWEFAQGGRAPVVRLPNGVAALETDAGGLWATYESQVVRIDEAGFTPVWEAPGFVKDLAVRGDTVWVGTSGKGTWKVERGAATRLSELSNRRLAHTGGTLVALPSNSDLDVDGRSTGLRVHGDMSAENGRVLGEMAPGLVRVVDLATHEILFEHPVDREVWGVALTRDGTRAAWALSDHRVRMADLGSGVVTELVGQHEANVHALAFSPSGRRLASASWDGTSFVWRDGKLEAALEAHTGRVVTLVFVEEDLLVTGSWDRTVRRWDLTAWNGVFGL